MNKSSGFVKEGDVTRLRNIATFIRDKGASAAIAADARGMSSMLGDLLVEQSDAFLAGLDGVLPESFKKYVEEYDTINDPEYAEYQRLAKKFGKTV